MTINATPLALDASLHLLADHLVDALAADELEPALLTAGDVAADGFALGVRPLGGAHPADLLLGFRPADDVHAVGVAARGWASRLADEASDRTRIELVTFVSRTGEVVHRTRPGLDGLGEPPSDAPTGEQMDLLRRSVGLSTAPPPVEASWLWACEWLLRIASSEKPPASRAELVALHPGFEFLGAAETVRDAQPIEALDAFSRVANWAYLHAQAGRTAFDRFDLRAEDARWMDTGSFARWVLRRTPPLEQCRNLARARLHPAASAALDGLLAEIDLPETEVRPCW